MHKGSRAVPRTCCILLWGTTMAWSAMAADRRDIVFDCPCSAEWVAGEPDEQGSLTLHGGVRSYRAVESGEVRVSNRWFHGTHGASAGRLPEHDGRQGPWTLAFSEPKREAVIELHLLERISEDPAGGTAQWLRHETLALWPVAGETSDGSRRFVDILTDSDGDGVGDVNERLAGTAWDDPESMPGGSDIDLLALYTSGFREAEGGYPYTRMLHVLSVVAALFEDSGTNIRLRTVGMAEVELGANGWAGDEARTALMRATARTCRSSSAQPVPPAKGGSRS